MKKLIAIILLSTMLIGCASSMVTSNCELAKPYGIANEKIKNEKVEYQTAWLNVAAGFVLLPTLAVPVYIVLFELFEPVKDKK